MKKNLLQKRWLSNAILISALMMSFYSTILHAESSFTNDPNNPSNSEILSKNASGTSSWTLDATVNNVECYYKIITCNGAATVFLKFINNNTGAVKVSWKEVFKTQVAAEEKGLGAVKELVLQPGSTTENDCSSSNPITIIKMEQVSPFYPAKIEQFKFVNITVTNL